MIATDHLFAGIPVTDRDAAAGWYEPFVARPADLIPNEDEAAWQLTPSSWIYVFADQRRAGSAIHTLLVDDLDAFLAELAARGIATDAVETLRTSVRVSAVTDPNGNRLKVGQPPDASRP